MQNLVAIVTNWLITKFAPQESLSSPMKIIKPILALALACPMLVAAQNPASVGPATVALTISYSKPGLLAKDPEGKIIPADEGGMLVHENTWSVNKVKIVKIDGESTDIPVSDEEITEKSTKLGTWKYSNKEILQDLLFMDLLPGIGENDPAIAGWTLIQVSDAGEEGFASTGRFMARHSSKLAVDITGSIDLMMGEEGSSAVTVTGKSSIKTSYNSAGEELPNQPKATESYSMTYKTPGSFSMSEGIYQGSGLLTGGHKLTLVSGKVEGDPETYTERLYVPTAMKLANIVGAGSVFIFTSEEDGEEVPAVIEGSMSVGAGKAYFDISTYITD